MQFQRSVPSVRYKMGGICGRHTTTSTTSKTRATIATLPREIQEGVDHKLRVFG
jgi:hypothetical protein